MADNSKRPGRDYSRRPESKAAVIDRRAARMANVGLYVRGERVPLSRPLNSRDAWPLWAMIQDERGEDDEIEVFTGEGDLSPEFLAFIQGGAA